MNFFNGAFLEDPIGFFPKDSQAKQMRTVKFTKEDSVDSEALKIAKDLKFGSIILLGHEKYYPKFGYEMTKKYGIKLPFEVPDENCMLIELTENALENINGTVEYPMEFYE